MITAVRMFEQYLQCTPPPKQDLFPQRCSSSVDCFPNLCCAEGGKKHCRPPQRSLLALLAGVTQVLEDFFFVKLEISVHTASVTAVVLQVSSVTYEIIIPL